MPDLEYKITTSSDASGAKQAGKAIDDLKSKTADATAENKKAAESQEEINIKGRANYLLFSELDRIVPGLGHELHAAFAGPIGPVILLGIAISKVYDELQKFNTELDKIGDQELTAHQNAIKAIQDAWDNARGVVAKYYADLQTAGIDNDPTKTQIARIKAVETAQIDSTKKIIEALGKQEVAWIRAHGGTDEQIAAAEARTATESAALDSKLQHATGSEALQDELKRRTGQTTQLRDQALADQKTADRAQQKSQEQKDERTKLRESLKPGGELDQAVQTAYDALNKIQEDWGDHPPDDYQKFLVEGANEKLAKANDARQLARQRLSQLEGNQFTTDEAAAEAQARFEASRQASITNQARIAQLPAEIDQAKKVEGAEDYGQKAIDLLNQHGGQMNETLGQLAQETGKSHTQTINIVKEILECHRSFQQVMAQLQVQLKNLQGQARNNQLP